MGIFDSLHRKKGSVNIEGKEEDDGFEKVSSKADLGLDINYNSNSHKRESESDKELFENTRKRTLREKLTPSEETKKKIRHGFEQYQQGKSRVSKEINDIMGDAPIFGGGQQRHSGGGGGQRAPSRRRSVTYSEEDYFGDVSSILEPYHGGSSTHRRSQATDELSGLADYDISAADILGTPKSSSRKKGSTGSKQLPIYRGSSIIGYRVNGGSKRKGSRRSRGIADIGI